MKIKIISNYRSNSDTDFSVTNEVVPNIGDEVIWSLKEGAFRWSPKEVMFRGTVKKRIIDYTTPEVLHRSHSFDVILEMMNTIPLEKNE